MDIYVQQVVRAAFLRQRFDPIPGQPQAQGQDGGENGGEYEQKMQEIRQGIQSLPCEVYMERLAEAEMYPSVTGGEQIEPVRFGCFPFGFYVPDKGREEGGGQYQEKHQEEDGKVSGKVKIITVDMSHEKLFGDRPCPVIPQASQGVSGGCIVVKIEESARSHKDGQRIEKTDGMGGSVPERRQRQDAPAEAAQKGKACIVIDQIGQDKEEGIRFQNNR